MPSVSRKRFLNVGLYTPAEAAYYARVHTSTMKRWIHGDRRGAPVVHAELRDDPNKTVTFLDFVQALAIRAIRREHRVPLSKIREAVRHAQKRYGVPYPFAMQRHKTYLFERDVVIDLQVGLVQISGKRKDQILIREIAELYMEDLSFDRKGLAAKYRAFAYRDREIVMDPSRRLGQPVVLSCGYTASALLDAYRTEGSVAAAAETHGVSPEDIELVIRYDDFLQGTALAA